MAKKRSTSSLMKKLGSAGTKAVAAHANDDTTFSSGGDLPEGIDFGIAQLVDCEFSQYQKGDLKGEYYFRAAGIVVEPDQVGNIKVAGLRTQIMEPICETPGRSRESVEEHIQWVLNEMRKLGVDTSEVDGDNLEETAEALKDEKPFFNFRTWKGTASEAFPNPRVNHDWRGVCDYVPTDEEDEVVETESEDASVVGDPEEVESETDDLSELASDADGGDEEAQTKITDAAEAKGVDPDTYETWTDVVAAITGASDDTEPEAEAEEVEPEKGEIYKYKPPKARKFVECEVSAVFEGKKTCNLKNLANQKVYKAVPWSKLVEAEDE